MNEPNCAMLEFRKILQLEGVSLESEGVADIALSPEAASRAIDALRAAQVGVCGGEVWRHGGGGFFPTYDIWDVDANDYANSAEYICASLNIAERQVAKYLRASDDVYIVLGI